MGGLDMDTGRCSAENLEAAERKKNKEIIELEIFEVGCGWAGELDKTTFGDSGEARVVVIEADGSPSFSFSVEMSLSAVSGVFFTEVA